MKSAQQRLNEWYILGDAKAVETGYLERKEASAEVIVYYLLQVLPPTNSVMDLGCGNGAYLQAFKRQGVHDLLGVDIGSEHELIPQIKYCVRIADLSKPFDMKRMFDLVICLEVIEHLDPKDTEVLMQTITQHSNIVVFSGANPAQNLDPSHKNMKHASEWLRIFSKHGYALWLETTLDVRGLLPAWVDWWIPRNLMIFRRVPND